MNYITSLLTSLCACLILIGVLFIICPDGVMSKSVKYILSLIFLISVISVAGIGVSDQGKSFDFKTEASVDSSDFEIQNARLVYMETLKKSGLEFKEITVLTDKSEDGSIVINKIIVNSFCEKEKIINALSEIAKTAEVEVIDE